ncbi:CBS domain-containing protein [Streptomyces sp. S.PB5]|uniref:CBS domain-containing protein n=1 Tax=Streptomyces sp. S.PB5 TaxID=3020844 RepID=UPI0025AF61AD|nr:CBS domain-containing protein [Streptomyces sp. S.PB5]MDN3029222.1 CBS domain-containing protein [Streptomyces sp. S.PB5]
MTRTVGEVMTREVVQARPETSFKDVARLLDRHHVSGLPVVDHDDKVLGVISGTDLVRHQAAHHAGGRARRLRGSVLRRSARRTTAAAGATTAGELMSSPAITVHPEQRVPDAARVMARHRIGRLPVVDEEDRLIGIATRRDLLQVFLRTDEEIRRDVADGVLAPAMGPAPHPVAVSVRDGLVRLTGQVERRSDIPRAVRLAWRVDGVVGVVNDLTFRLDDGGLSEQPLPDRPALS